MKCSHETVFKINSFMHYERNLLLPHRDNTGAGRGEMRDLEELCITRCIKR
jgi:hypothetical protein